MLKEKCSQTLVKDGKADLCSGIGTAAVECHSGGEISGSTPNAAWAGGNLWIRSWVGVSRKKITKRKHQGVRKALAKPA